MAGAWGPELTLRETGDGCRLVLAGLAHGNGSTLQDAADDLVSRLLTLVLCTQASGLRVPRELGSFDRRLADFLWELGEIASRGDDIRERVFGHALP